MICGVDLGPMLKPDALIDEPVVVRVNDFDEKAAAAFAKDVGKAVSLGQGLVPVVIDSYGGQVYSLLAMVEVIRSCPVPVATILQGKAMSCGAILLAMGTPNWRYCAPGGHVLLHHISSLTYGPAPTIKVDAAQTERLDRQVFEMLDLQCGHPRGTFLDRLAEKEGADWYLSPREAKALRLVDHIGTPRLQVTVDVAMELVDAPPPPKRKSKNP